MHFYTLPIKATVGNSYKTFMFLYDPDSKYLYVPDYNQLTYDATGLKISVISPVVLYEQPTLLSGETKDHLDENSKLPSDTVSLNNIYNLISSRYGAQLLRNTDAITAPLLNVILEDSWKLGSWRAASSYNNDSTGTYVSREYKTFASSGGDAPVEGLGHYWQISNTTKAAGGVTVDISQDYITGLKPGKTYTISCWARASKKNTTAILRLQVWRHGSNTADVQEPFTVDDEWGFYSATFTHGNARSGAYFGLTVVKGKASSIDICGMKLCEGSDAGQWTKSLWDITGSDDFNTHLIKKLDTLYSDGDEAAPIGNWSKNILYNNAYPYLWCRRTLNLSITKESTYTHADILACAPIRACGQRYKQYINIGDTIDPDSQIEVQVNASDGCTPAVCSTAKFDEDERSHIDITFDGTSYINSEYGSGPTVKYMGGSITPDNISQVFYNIYGKKCNIIQNQVALRDENNIYAIFDNVHHSSDGKIDGYYNPKGLTSSPTGNIYYYALSSGELPVWKPGLLWVASIEYELSSEGLGDTITDDLESNINIIYTSAPTPCSQHDYAVLSAGMTDSFNNINMNIYHPRIANITKQEVINMQSTADPKANIVQPIFFRAHTTSRIIVHPEVTENISINLDIYKSAVTTFYLKIDGVSYKEIGRTERGVIFKIKGSLLDDEIADGVYYILNEDGDVITSGNYVIER